MPIYLTVHRGAHEIGGNCIEIEGERSRLILDAGMPLFRADREPHDSRALQRKSKDELEAAGILPTVPGLFGDGGRPTAILLSHAHQDHTGLLHHSHPEIPIYTTRGTSKMMAAGAKFAGQPYLPRQRFHEVLPTVPFEVGEFTVTGFSVDHSIYGALAFLIEVNGTRILYSGDLRLHGRKPGMARALIDSVARVPVDLLLMEGTHIEHAGHRGPNEFELEAEITRHIESNPGLVLASFSPQHIDRFVAFLRSTRKTGRTLVVDAYAGYILHLMRNEIPVPAPESTEWIKVFFPKYFEESYERKRLKTVFTLLSPANIRMDEIRSNPAKYVMLFRPSMLASDFSSSLPPSTRCIFSSWNGYLEREEWKLVQDVLHKSGGELVQAHTSGHIYADDIQTFLDELRPRSVVPIHTFAGHDFARLGHPLTLLRDGERHQLNAKG
ncbi:MBL fold metallo-hydrolase [Anatilimnocola floriformis]|uniref:MBL fold metallo-hydrolase n=1 Tax=Anatilimnocola floriformis TaxID=2948575 RepID=UPI0020C37F6A|nr:MBL fold metallo-hydrolase [Anatilimnocola floriformis]